MMDSVDKIVTIYFTCITPKPFTYKKKTYNPRPLKVSPLIFRGFICNPYCGACCRPFSLDYLPEPIEKHPDTLPLEKRYIKIDDREVEVWSDLQKDTEGYHCKNVNQKDGRCSVHGVHPFSCDFELIRFMRFKDQNPLPQSYGTVLIDTTKRRPNVLTHKLYGRVHAMLRVDGERGGLCEMTPPDREAVAEVVRKLNRLKVWCNHFGIGTERLDKIIRWAEEGEGNPRAQPLVV